MTCLIHNLYPNKTDAKAFGDYASMVFLPYISKQFVSRLDVIWDVYKAGSLNSHVRASRGTGESLRVATNTKLPRNWKTFLRGNLNKSGDQLYVETLGKIISTDNLLSVHAVTATALAGANARRLACYVLSWVFL